MTALFGKIRYSYPSRANVGVVVVVVVVIPVETVSGSAAVVVAPGLSPRNTISAAATNFFLTKFRSVASLETTFLEVMNETRNGECGLSIVSGYCLLLASLY